uniref:Uncharacterized protein n=1 Tax=Arundo donax TaxID=35708 RepID=A0A0A9D475_ARUDO
MSHGSLEQIVWLIFDMLVTWLIYNEVPFIKVFHHLTKVIIYQCSKLLFLPLTVFPFSNTCKATFFYKMKFLNYLFSLIQLLHFTEAVN